MKSSSSLSRFNDLQRGINFSLSSFQKTWELWRLWDSSPVWGQCFQPRLRGLGSLSEPAQSPPGPGPEESPSSNGRAAQRNQVCTLYCLSLDFLNWKVGLVITDCGALSESRVKSPLLESGAHPHGGLSLPAQTLYPWPLLVGEPFCSDLEAIMRPEGLPWWRIEQHVLKGAHPDTEGTEKRGRS